MALPDTSRATPSPYAAEPPVVVGPPQELSVAALIAPLLRRRVLVVRLALLGLAAGAATGLLRERTYTATASFVTQGRRAPSAVSGIAAQFGVAIPGNDATQTPHFYVDLITSRTLLTKVAESPVPGPGGRVPLWSRLELKDTVPVAVRRDAAISALRRAVGATADVKTGLVRLAVTLPDSALARAVGERVLELVNTFNLERRRLQATAERRFTEERLRLAERELRSAEATFEDFTQRNRDIIGSPALVLTNERLRRAVNLKEQLYLSLVQLYEQARFDEVRDTPVITVMEEPATPARADPRGTVARGLAGGLAGVGVGLLIAFLGLASHRPGSPAAEMAQLRTLARDAAADLRRPWRLLLGSR